jgi:proline iminopeptidase
MTERALLLHGGPGLPDYLDPLAGELAPLFELDRYTQGRHFDVPGFVAEALEHLHAPSWIVGHSWGGYLALQVAAAAPERVTGLVLIGSLGAVGDGGWKAAGPRLVARLTGEEQARLEEAAPGAGLAILWPAYFSRRELVPPYPGWTLDPEVLEATYGWVQEHGAELAPRLRSFDHPVLILHGTFDHIPPEPVEETATLLPNAELRVLDGIGHFPWLEQPGLVHDAVVDFRTARSS